VLYNVNKYDNGRETYKKSVEENHNLHSKHGPGLGGGRGAVKESAMKDENFKSNALWPENVRRDQQASIPHRSRTNDVYRGRDEKDANNALVNFYTEPDLHHTSAKVQHNDLDNNNKNDSNGGYTPGEVIQACVNKDARATNKTKHLHATAKEMRKSKSRDKWRPGLWSSDLPEYGQYRRIMNKRPNSASATRNRGYGGFSDGSYPEKFRSKEKPQQRPRSAGAGRTSERDRGAVRGGGGRKKPSSASATRRMQPPGRYGASEASELFEHP